jgi:hypothetical protein
MEDRTDAPQCWKSESILVYGGADREPIDIVPYLVDKEVEYASLMRNRKRLEFPPDVYPPSWEKRHIIQNAVKNAVAEADNINLNVQGTKPSGRYPIMLLACEMARSYRPPKNSNESQATVYANKEDLPRLDKTDVRQDRMVNLKKTNRVNPKRITYTEKPPPDECCVFRIQLSLDPGKCWFLLPWAGCRCHKFHPRRSPSEKRRRSKASGTEAVFTALSNQIESVDPFIKEISALYEGNSTQAEIDECKTFLAAQMEECKTFLNSKIVAKKAELVKSNAGGAKGKRVWSSEVSNKKHKHHGTAHMR